MAAYKIFVDTFKDIEETAEQIKVAAAKAKAAALDELQDERDRIVNEFQHKNLAAIRARDGQGGGRLRRCRSRKKNTRRRMRRKRSRRCRR